MLYSFQIIILILFSYLSLDLPATLFLQYRDKFILLPNHLGLKCLYYINTPVVIWTCILEAHGAKFIRNFS